MDFFCKFRQCFGKILNIFPSWVEVVAFLRRTAPRIEQREAAAGASFASEDADR